MFHTFSKALMFLGLASLLAFVLTGCGGDTSNLTGKSDVPTTKSMVFTIEPRVGSDDPNIMSEDGTMLSTEEMKTLLASTKDNDQLIQLKVASDELASAGSDKKGISVWKYWADIRWEYGYVPGCIHANTWHLNLHLRDTWANRELVNIHIASWWQNGPQFGIYNSGAGSFCLQSRGTFTAIRSALSDYFQRSVGMPAWAASSMAYSVAVVCVCCLPFLVWA